MKTQDLKKKLFSSLAKRMMNQFQIELPNNPFAYDIRISDTTATITAEKLSLEANFVKDADGDYCLTEILLENQRYL